jgi:hypothetical protein
MALEHRQQNTSMDATRLKWSVSSILLFLSNRHPGLTILFYKSLRRP